TPPNVPGPPMPLAADTATPEADVDFVHRTRGVNIHESAIRTRYRYDGWEEQITVAYQSIEPERPNYSAVRVPALAIYAIADSASQLEPWQRSDSANAAGYQDLVRGMETAERPLREQFKREVPRSRVVEIHSGQHCAALTLFEAPRRPPLVLRQPRRSRLQCGARFPGRARLSAGSLVEEAVPLFRSRHDARRAPNNQSAPVSRDEIVHGVAYSARDDCGKYSQRTPHTAEVPEDPQYGRGFGQHH